MKKEISHSRKSDKAFYHEGGWKEEACNRRKNTKKGEKWQQGVGYITVISKLPKARLLSWSAADDTWSSISDCPHAVRNVFAANADGFLVLKQQFTVSSVCFSKFLFISVCTMVFLSPPTLASGYSLSM